ncbi:uncharacterized protein PHALS_02171 [Plasmopara halstedii]|uniref:WLGC domain-containing protein n=1 Tax=Plasmopara halstedii TaxID=4781 RepID=A0A0P1A7Z7_PLAHL|nr:uncharacterized protein PHALS_02171 [Plasmopara halstedii]CEG36258.1 hypothetical protein PHALS_02171 [Plasmopara halstedii]|eukprot:XP_024572627.1 hypothetical protein PHALS_02171 [Plasmopara halstedii]
MLNIDPIHTVNCVMDTKELDDGAFWLFVDPSPFLFWLSFVGLSIAGIGYLVILVKMVARRRRRVMQTPELSTISTASLVQKVTSQSKLASQIALRFTSSTQSIRTLIQTDRISRRFALGMKLGDLAFETVLLIQILEAGSPEPIIAIFTFIIISNALTCVVTMFIPLQRIGLVETTVDLLFDLLIVVVCPILVLVFCMSAFTFPRDIYAINHEVFPPGWFERQASVVADPAQTAVIYENLKSIRITSVVNFIARMAVNVTLYMRLHRMVNLIPWRQQSCIYPRKHRIAALLLVAYAILLVIFVEESVRTSAIACDPHPECVLHARRWTYLKSNSLTQCPCLVMIDRDVAPKTYDEWEQPLDVTKKVAQLASRGDLKTMQLTNRYLPTLPEELRRCTNLIHLTLEYTHTQTLPDWIKELANLEFLHLESKFTSPFISLPNDMFEDMTSLTFIHLAGFVSIKRLPSFQGLTKLKSLTLAAFLLLDQLPAFDHLLRLERLLVTCAPSLDSLPDLAPVKKNLKSLILTDRGTWCCNGFLDSCNQRSPMCQIHPLWGTPAASCLASDRERASSATLALLTKFPTNVCNGLLLPGSLEGPPTRTTMDPCNGTLYRQCIDVNGVESMCYNARYMGIACDSNPFPINMRRRQIAQSIGEPCNPRYEAWLGCESNS